MASPFLLGLLALAAAPAAPATLDLNCYRLMAELAADTDPRISAAGITGAQYFLGRIDAAAPGFDPDGMPAQVAQEERERLVGQCGALMGAGGRDFRALGRLLAGPRDSI